MTNTPKQNPEELVNGLRDTQRHPIVADQERWNNRDVNISSYDRYGTTQLRNAGLHTDGTRLELRQQQQPHQLYCEYILPFLSWGSMMSVNPLDFFPKHIRFVFDEVEDDVDGDEAYYYERYYPSQNDDDNNNNQQQNVDNNNIEYDYDDDDTPSKYAWPYHIRVPSYVRWFFTISVIVLLILCSLGMVLAIESDTESFRLVTIRREEKLREAAEESSTADRLKQQILHPMFGNIGAQQRRRLRKPSINNPHRHDVATVVHRGEILDAVNIQRDLRDLYSSGNENTTPLRDTGDFYNYNPNQRRRNRNRQQRQPTHRNAYHGY